MTAAGKRESPFPALPLALLLAVYAGAVLLLLGRTPLWLDELLQLGMHQHRSVSTLLREVTYNPGAAPLGYLFQKAVVDLLGFSTVTARAPAALCSLLSGLVFAILAPRFGIRRPVAAAALLLLLPLQFRYAVEGRVYSQGLLFSLVSLWLFLRLMDHPSPPRAAAYFFSLALGLYSQPFSMFPALAQGLWAAIHGKNRLRLLTFTAISLAGVAFVPWYLTLEETRWMWTTRYFFSPSQIAPLTLFHEISGGGYLCTIPLAVLAAWSLGSAGGPLPRLAVFSAAICLAGPILLDATFHYFFAERQLLFAMPPLLILAARGAEQLEVKSRAAAAGLVLLLVVASGVKDYRQSVTPKDDLAAAAHALPEHLTPGACLMPIPPRDVLYYSFFQPELKSRVCGTAPQGRDIVAVRNIYTTPQEEAEFSRSLPDAYLRAQEFRAGRIRIEHYVRR